jgi:predicted nucleotidyltransferase
VGVVSVERLRLMSELLGWRVQSLSCDVGVEGVMVFGSFARRSVTGPSDLDLFVVRSDLKETYSRVRAEERGIVIEENSWSVQTLEELFCGVGEGEMGLFTDLFLVNVFRPGRILYDPSGRLCSYQEYSRGYRIPEKYVVSLRKKSTFGATI